MAVIHPTAEVAPSATIGPRTRVWHFAQVRDGAVIGADCVLGKDVYVDRDVRVGDACKLQNGVYVFHGFTVEDGVFLGPGVMLLNDKHPRAINPDGTPKGEADWSVSEGVVGYGAAVGGGAILLPGVKVGRMAVIGAGAVVTRDVAERAIVVGHPARQVGVACDCGFPMDSRDGTAFACGRCGRTYP
jgi:UDP-2-acetamido-3-amino-2,3-dideoxy-glucuronate N-acetyltransferase